MMIPRGKRVEHAWSRVACFDLLGGGADDVPLASFLRLAHRACTIPVDLAEELASPILSVSSENHSDTPNNGQRRARVRVTSRLHRAPRIRRPRSVVYACI